VEVATFDYGHRNPFFFTLDEGTPISISFQPMCMTIKSFKYVVMYLMSLPYSTGSVHYMRREESRVDDLLTNTHLTVVDLRKRKWIRDWAALVEGLY
jgi:hypothetical protein